MLPSMQSTPQVGAKLEKHRAYEALGSIGLPELRSQIYLLEQYIKLLMHWNQRINLTAIRDEDSIWTHHILDCLAILPLVRARLARQNTKTGQANVLDAGTGAGLPALLLALTEPTWNIVAVDAVEKKVRFVRQASAMMGLKGVKPIHARLEQLRFGEDSHGLGQIQGFDMIVSRAYASLDEFVASTQHLCHPMGFYCAMKGQVPHHEIETFLGARPNWQLETVRFEVPGLDAQRCAVIIRPPALKQASLRPLPVVSN
jgi:16S rRNA (guanine527-N7)-methyltransferase